MQYTDIALAAVLCSIAQVPVAKTTTTPHLIGGKTLHRSLEFFYSLTCKGRLWAIMSPIRIMFTSSQWRSKNPTRVATTLVYIYIYIYKRTYRPANLESKKILRFLYLYCSIAVCSKKKLVDAMLRPKKKRKKGLDFLNLKSVRFYPTKLV